MVRMSVAMFFVSDPDSVDVVPDLGPGVIYPFDAHEAHPIERQLGAIQHNSHHCARNTMGGFKSC